MIKVENVVKSFGDFKAVDGVSFEVEEGEIFGLLGANGAGKTTLMSMLSTYLQPDSGSISISGHDLKKNSVEARRLIGVVFQEYSIDEKLTGRENLEIAAQLYGLPESTIKERVNGAISLVGLEEWGNVFVKKYSSGMKRRLELVRALVHGPKILFLDEPTSGLDPRAREEIWKHIEGLKVTTVLSTNYMEEAERLCRRVAILDKGKIIATGKPKELKAVVKGDVLVLKAIDTDMLEKTLRKKYKKVNVVGNKIVLFIKNGEEAIPEIARLAGENLKSVEMHSPTLNDVFLHYTGREIEAI